MIIDDIPQPLKDIPSWAVRLVAWLRLRLRAVVTQDELEKRLAEFKKELT